METKKLNGFIEFSNTDILQIQELKNFMSHAHDVSTWNNLRKQAFITWDEKIISAVDGSRKWVINKDKCAIGVFIA